MRIELLILLRKYCLKLIREKKVETGMGHIERGDSTREQNRELFAHIMLMFSWALETVSQPSSYCFIHYAKSSPSRFKINQSW